MKTRLSSSTCMFMAAAMLDATSDPAFSSLTFGSSEGVRFSDKSKILFRHPHRPLQGFSIHGYKIMAYSRKDAIKRLKYQKKI